MITGLDEIGFTEFFDNMLTNILYEHNKYEDFYYIGEQAFRRRLGLGVTKFYEWKRLGRFEKAMQTRGSKRTKYHKYFNVYTNKIEVPELKRLPIQPKTKRRKDNGKKAAKAATPQSSSQEGDKSLQTDSGSETPTQKEQVKQSD
ncbi:hypothetical protein R83H12_00415 [Fibrobacteria bacterium R8-3-H12]